ncbi:MULTISPECIES: glycosyltransferase [Aeromonas]|uniref:glycosyltransferase n=1 Tax=Aeromonas TaxID=642 RepID=UPI000696B8E6|nr:MULTISPECIES: glycosyltransferase [Aeromonas]MBL0666732.1 glycosyltransferase [Aeromonas jandaei]
MSSILFVLGGLNIGGVETYVIRLAKELREQGENIDFILLSNSFNAKNYEELSKFASIYILDYFPLISSSSWLNAMSLCGEKLEEKLGKKYDIVHVVDLMTLGFVFFNKDKINFTNLSIGIYHAKEISWWRDRSCYFRESLLKLYDKNVMLTLFPNEFMLKLADDLIDSDLSESHILPLGIDLEKYKAISPIKSSLKIVSVGRLVDFKTYNRHVITLLKELREIAPFEYFIYGDGPEKNDLLNLAKKLGVCDFVHFMGSVEYSDLHSVLDGCFCFIGSGTTIIEASSAGIPSIVGIESIKMPLTCGFFSEVKGFSYNEDGATDTRVSIYDKISSLYYMNNEEFQYLSGLHRDKAAEFNIKKTTSLFVSYSSKKPDFSLKINRYRALLSFIFSVLKFGPNALKSRFDL